MIALRRADTSLEEFIPNVNIRNTTVMMAVASALVAAGAGCRRTQQVNDREGPIVIPVSLPIDREIVDYIYYTGRIDAPQSVEIRARVTGYLTKLPFKEGAEVKEGDLLFEIDPRPYQAQYDANKAQVEQREAALRLAKSELNRSNAINMKTAGAISREELEKNSASDAQAAANLNLAKANFDLAKLDLDFTKVLSPIDGIVSRYFLTKGNLVSMDQTLLTTVVSVEPMYAFFDMDERTVLRVRTLINQGKIHAVKDIAEITVNMGLEGEEGFPHKGTLNFVNNIVNLSTGTITARGVFPNPKPENGRRLLTPGMFVRIQLPIGSPYKAILVAERALSSDQGAKFLYVVDDSKKVQYRRVKVGAQQDDGLIEIAEGIKPHEWVVVGALPQVRPRMEVEPEKTPMPALGSMDEDIPVSPPAGTEASKTPAPKPTQTKTPAKSQ